MVFPIAIAVQRATIRSIFYDAIKARKVGQCDLVVRIRRLFTIVSLCAKFQVSVYSGYGLCMLPFNVTDRQTCVSLSHTVAQVASNRSIIDYVAPYKVSNECSQWYGY